MNDTKDGVLNRIDRYVKKGDLDLDATLRDLVKLQESGNKRVYLYEASPSALRKLDLARLPRLKEDLADVTILSSPASPGVSYSWVGGEDYTNQLCRNPSNCGRGLRAPTHPDSSNYPGRRRVS